MNVPALALAPATKILSHYGKWLLTSPFSFAHTAAPITQLKTKNAPRPFKSVYPRMPHTIPETMDRNWNTVSFTLALFATFSGSTNVSFLPASVFSERGAG